MLIKMGIKYGSQESIDLCNFIGCIIVRTAIIASAELAKEKGFSYPNFNYDSLIKSQFYNAHTDNVVDSLVQEHGLLNSQLLTIAPTGSLSTMFGVSGGIEPIYANSYTRKTESLHGKDEYYKVYTPIVKEYMDKHGLKDESELPEYFVTAKDLDYKSRIDMQAIWQKHIDASISSTVNVPNSFTIEETEELYMYAWERGLKGVTIFRDGCKRTGILTTDESQKKEEPKKQQVQKELQRGDILCVSDDLLSMKRTIVNGCGKFYLHVDFDESTGEPLETFIDIGSGGGCERNLQFISRLISLALRAGVPLSEIIDQTTSIRPCKAYTDRTTRKKDTSKGTSCPSAIGHALKELQEKINARCFVEDEDFEDVELCTGTCESCSLCNVKEEKEQNYSVAKCPYCGEPLAFEGGCNVCKACGWSKCDL